MKDRSSKAKIFVILWGVNIVLVLLWYLALTIDARDALCIVYIWHLRRVIHKWKLKFAIFVSLPRVHNDPMVYIYDFFYFTVRLTVNLSPPPPPLRSALHEFLFEFFPYIPFLSYGGFVKKLGRRVKKSPPSREGNIPCWKDYWASKYIWDDKLDQMIGRHILAQGHAFYLSILVHRTIWACKKSTTKSA